MSHSCWDENVGLNKNMLKAEAFQLVCFHEYTHILPASNIHRSVSCLIAPSLFHSSICNNILLLVDTDCLSSKTFDSKDMAEAANFDEGLNCSICHEKFLDPRILPCGHSYCGPPRTCLNSMQSGDNKMTCAICRSNFFQRVSDIKPLYGIRDHFGRSWPFESENRSSKILSCQKHSEMECKLWCLECDINVCEQCIEQNHDGHPVRNLRKHLMEKIEAKVGQEWYRGMTSYLLSLETLVSTSEQKLRELRMKVSSIEKFIDDCKQKETIVRSCINPVEEKCGQSFSKIETSLLLQLSCIQFTLPSCSVYLDFLNSASTQVEISQSHRAVQVGEILDSPAPICENTDQLKLSHQRSSQEPPIYCVPSTTARLTHLTLHVPSSSIYQLEEASAVSLLFRLEIEQKKPLRVRPSNKVRLGNVVLEMLAYCQSCELHRHLKTCPDFSLHIKVVLSFEPIKFGPHYDLRSCKLTLLNHHPSSARNLEMKWAAIDDYNTDIVWQVMNFGNFLSPKNYWMASDKHIVVSMTIKFDY